MTPWPVDQPIPKTVTLPQVLKILQVSRRTFERRWAEGKVPFIELQTIGRERRFQGASIEKWLRGRFTPEALRRPA